MTSTSTYAPEMIRITTYITREQDDNLNSLAETTGKKKSELIRDSITSFTSNQDDETGIEDMDAFLEEFQSGFAKYAKPTFQQSAYKTFIECIGEPTQIQTNICDRLATYSRVIICSPRQCGLTAMLCMLAAYRASSKQCNVVVGIIKESYNERYRNEIITYLKCMSTVVITNSTKSSITLSNKSTISIVSYASNAFASALADATNEFILDEFAYAKPVTQMESIADKLIQHCRIPHFKVFIGSVPNTAIRYSDDGYPILTQYYRLWAYAMATDSPLRAIQIPSDATRVDNFDFIDHDTFYGRRRYTNEAEGTFAETTDESFIDVIDSSVEEND